MREGSQNPFYRDAICLVLQGFRFGSSGMPSELDVVFPRPIELSVGKGSPLLLPLPQLPRLSTGWQVVRTWMPSSVPLRICRAT